MNKFFPVAFVFFIVIAALQTSAQQFEHRGIQLYKEGKNAEAVSILSIAVKQKGFKSDAAMWNYLGLAYVATSEFKKGRKALEKAVKLAPNSSPYHTNLAYAYLLFRLTNKAQTEAAKAIALDPKNATAYYFRGSASLWEQKLDDAQRDADQILAIDAGYPQGYVFSSNILVARLGQKLAKETEISAVRENVGFLRDARDILSKGVEMCKNSPNRKLVEDEFESMDAFYNHFSKEPRAPGQAVEPGVTPVKIISKPKAAYTDAARQAGIQGTIRLAILLGANANIQHVLILKRLGYGLDEQALKAARQIKFEPKTKDGKPISTVLTLEYTFSIH